MASIINRLVQPRAREILILVAVVLMLTLPFINRAFDWDDGEFIEFAEVYSESPTRLHLDNFSYKGNHYEEFTTSHPPLLSLYLSMFLRLGFDVGEILFHIAYIVFPLVAAVSMYALARRFTGYPLLAALLLVFTPGFIVMSHSLMGDIPGLSLWLAAVALYVWGVDRRDWRMLGGSGLVMAIAVMVSYQNLSVLPLLLLYALIKRRFALSSFLPFLAPAAVFLAYVLWNYSLYDAGPVFSYRVGIRFGWQDLDLKFRALLTFIGGATVFPLVVMPLFMRRKYDLLAAFIILPPLVTWAALYFLAKGDMTLIQAMILAVFVSSGFLFLYKMVETTIRAAWSWVKKRQGWTDSLFLLAWSCGVVVYVMVFLPSVTVRYLLPLFPPLVLLFIRQTEDAWPMRPRLRGVFVTMALLLTLASGLFAGIADYRRSNLNRDLVERFSLEYGDSDRKVWFLGEFGWRYYMEQSGFEYLGISSVAHEGDIVISSQNSIEGVLAPLPEGSYRVLDQVEPGDPFPFRVMNLWANAGFYSHLVGDLPWVPSTAPLDRVTVNELDWGGRE